MGWKDKLVKKVYFQPRLCGFSCPGCPSSQWRHPNGRAPPVGKGGELQRCLGLLEGLLRARLHPKSVTFPRVWWKALSRTQHTPRRTCNKFQEVYGHTPPSSPQPQHGPWLRALNLGKHFSSVISQSNDTLTVKIVIFHSEISRQKMWPFISSFLSEALFFPHQCCLNIRKR